MTANLLSRLEGLTAPDREVDALILAWSEDRDVRYENGLLLAKSRHAPHDECVLGWVDPGKHSRNFTPQSESQPAYTSSIDATVALCERVLPGLHRALFQHPDGESLAVLSVPGMGDEGAANGHHKSSLCIALLIAILTALEARPSLPVTSSGTNGRGGCRKHTSKNAAQAAAYSRYGFLVQAAQR